MTEETLNDFSKCDENYFQKLLDRCKDGAEASAELLSNVLVRGTILRNNGKFDVEVFNELFFEKPLHVHSREVIQEYIGKMPFFSDDLFYTTMIRSLRQSSKAIKILEQEFAEDKAKEKNN